MNEESYQNKVFCRALYVQARKDSGAPAMFARIFGSRGEYYVEASDQSIMLEQVQAENAWAAK